MGCDIHLFAERLNQDWEYLPAPEDGYSYVKKDQCDAEGTTYICDHPYRYDWSEDESSVPFLREWFDDRNYALFGMLAGVRSQDYGPVDDPRGIPDNVSPEIQAEWIADGGHTPSWLMLSELLAYFSASDPYSPTPMGDLPETKRFQTFLTELGTYGTPESLRIIFYFDS